MTEALDKQKLWKWLTVDMENGRFDPACMAMTSMQIGMINGGDFDLPEKSCTLKDKWRVNATNTVSPYYGKCSECGEAISSFNKYCPFCGSKIVDVKE